MQAWIDVIDKEVFRSRLWMKIGIVGAVHLLIYVLGLLNASSLTDDSIQYLLLARNWVDHGVFSQSYFEPFVSDLQRTPGYPAFLVMTAQWIPLILLVQHLISLATAWLLHRHLVRAGMPLAARWAGWLYALLPYPLLFSSLVLSETLFVFLLVLAVAEGLRAFREPNLFRMLASSLAWGAAIMVRPVAWPMLLVFLLSLGIWVVFRRGKGLQVLAVAMVSLAIPFAWMWRNHELGGGFSLSTMGEMGMIHGRLGGLEAFRQGRSMDEHNLYMYGDSIVALEIGMQQIRRYPEALQTHETEQLSQESSKLTFRFFLEHPIDAVKFQAQRIGAMFTGIGVGWAEKVTGSRPLALGMGAFQAMMILWMLVGWILWMAGLRNSTAEERIIFLLICAGLFVSAAAWSDGRYRMVLDPFGIWVAVSGWKRWACRWKQNQSEELQPAE